MRTQDRCSGTWVGRQTWLSLHLFVLDMAKSKQFHVTISNSEFYETLKADAEQGITNWTINSRAQVGDEVLLYICAPVSAIVARATIETEPQIDEDPASPWFGHFLADMHSLIMLATPITRKQLIGRFRDWGYWMQPRNSIVVPAYFRKRLELLLKC